MSARRDLVRRRLAQLGVVYRLELGRQLRGAGFWMLALFALLPAVPFAGMWLAMALGDGGPQGVADTTFEYAAVFQSLILRVVLFFACIVVFTNLIRREMRDRTLHHWLLAPLRREVLLGGKYLAGVTTVFAVVGGGAVAAFGCAYAPHAALDPVGLADFFGAGPGWGHLAAYLGVVLLGCIGFGAAFLALGLVARGVILPALAVYGWEALNPFLPPALKLVSVLFYLNGLCPVPVDAGPFALLAEAPSRSGSVAGLVALAAVLVALGMWRSRRLELSYAEE